jgi:N-acetylglucosaminyldiphosphoundecaprenol N-acetyl-beta-D-mannosaminyltransferase
MDRESETTMTAASASSPTRRPVQVLGLPVTPYTTTETVDELDELVKSGRPAYIITANLNYAMLCSTDLDLHDVNAHAEFVVADGAPLVWWSRLIGQPLPERVAGSDLIYLVSARAAERGYRVYLLGAGPGVADEVAATLVERYPGLQIVGTESPPFRPLTADEQAAQLDRIRAAGPDILMLAFKMPDGERWLRDHVADLGIPLVLQFGASFDFVAGRVDRAPRWMQRTGLEWLYRTAQEPGRLAGRYGRNLGFLAKAFLTGRWITERRRAR